MGIKLNINDSNNVTTSIEQLETAKLHINAAILNLCEDHGGDVFAMWLQHAIIELS